MIKIKKFETPNENQIQLFHSTFGKIGIENIHFIQRKNYQDIERKFGKTNIYCLRLNKVPTEEWRVLFEGQMEMEKNKSNGLKILQENEFVLFLSNERKIEENRNTLQEMLESASRQLVSMKKQKRIQEKRERKRIAAQQRLDKAKLKKLSQGFGWRMKIKEVVQSIWKQIFVRW